jgi:aryl-alcohol dehydrogenase-like predicted oxidoreductase
MEYRTLGRSGLKVSTLTLGTMTFGGSGPFAAVGNSDLAEAKRMIDMCIDAGINLIDTANVYSNGLSEEIIGEALGGKRKGDVLIASKARMRIGSGPNDEGLSRYHLIRECEKSLKRLKTDGRHQPRFVTQQIHYTLEAREAEYELLPISVDQGLGVLVWSPLAGGLLSGKYRRDSPTARQLAGWSEPPIRDEDRLWRIVDVLVEIGKARGVSAAQVALAWLLGRPAVSSLVIGARNDAQLKDNLAAAALELGADDRQRLDAVSRPPLLYPYWHQQLTVKDRFGAADLVIDRSGV